MRSPPTVSVLTTIYNREAYLAEAVGSILTQRFEDFELILVDDRSTDRSAEIAQSYLTDPRVRFLQNEQNLGDYPNRNKAALHAKGRYLKYVDSDDTISPDCLEVMVSVMERFPEAALGLCKKPGRFPELPLELEPKEAYRMNYFESGIFGNAPLSTIIRRSAFEAVGGFSGRQYIGDGELWLRLAAEFNVVLMPHGLTRWRQHHDQQSTHGWGSGKQAIEEFKKDLRAIQAERCPLSTTEMRQARNRLGARTARSMLRQAIKGNPVMSFKQTRAMGLTAMDFLKAPFWVPHATERMSK